MWKSIFLFEIRYQLRQPLFYLVTLFLSILVGVWGTSDGLSAAFGKIQLNAPLITLDVMVRASLFGLFAVVAFVASAAVRDFDRQTSELFFSKPVPHRDYLVGRLTGSLVICFLMYVISALALAGCRYLPWLDAQRFGPSRLEPYLFSLGVIILPTLVALGTIFFALACWSRSLVVTYVGVVGCFAAFQLSRLLPSLTGSATLGQLLDPFGTMALSSAMQYWTIDERNAALPTLAGPLLYNRMLWLGIGLLVFGLCVATFRPGRSLRLRKAKRPSSHGAVKATARARIDLPDPPAFGRSTVLTQFLHQARLEVMSIFKSVPFLGILGFVLFMVVARAESLTQELGTPVYPHTYLMLEAVQLGGALLVIIITLYSGELIWRERSLGLSEVVDAAPTSNGVYLGSKLAALATVVLTCVGLSALTTMGFQASQGYYHFEPGLYAKGAVLSAMYPLMMCCLACFFQIAARGKFLGYGLMIAFVLSWDLIEEFGFEHHLYRFASLPAVPYSDMNGYGPFLKPFLGFATYWGLGCVALFGFSTLLWNRGTDSGWKGRWATARSRFQGSARGFVGVGLLGFLATGTWIFINTNLINDYLPSHAVQARQAAYEANYRQFEDAALPRIISVKTVVDLFPDDQRAEILGTFWMQNESDEPLRELHFNLANEVQVNRLDLPPHTIKLDDDTLGYTIYQLEKPMQPGEIIEIEFGFTVSPRGFVNHNPNTALVANGTFFSSRDALYFPFQGYIARHQLIDANTRRRHGLGPVQRMAKIDNPSARQQTFLLGPDSDWIEFETTVSTQADQIAIAPGALQKEWTEGDRRYFHYVMDQPILNFVAYMSAEYSVVRDRWNDVAIEVYHHPGHAYNVEHMIDAVKKSLDYMTMNFGPYPHRHLRLVETPRYTPYGARAFPGIITFSESAGFLARLDDSKDFDYVFRRVAHEVAHQWWGHQVIGANVQGATMLSETLAEYSALMIVQEEYGAAKLGPYLEYDLDGYLNHRGLEPVEEMPLARVEDQPYISYRKGGLAMYALQDHVGEAALNRALAGFLSEVAFQEPPFTTTDALLDVIRAAAPEKSQLIEDLFSTITLFDNKVVEASSSLQPDSTYLLRIVASAKKLRDDGQGVEHEIPIDDWIDIAVFGEDDGETQVRDEPLFMEKRHLTDSRVTFEIVVDRRPVRVEMDPYNKLIDRNPRDNVRRVVLEDPTNSE